VLSAEGLVAGYRSGYHSGRRDRPVVSVSHLQARRGELVAVIGPNGAGKSTLLRTLIGAQPALAGTVQLDGAPIDRLDRAERARRVAVVLTDRVDAGLLAAGEVVGLGRHPHTNWRGSLRPDDVAAARDAAERLGVTAWWDRRFAELSDGQRQRVLVARALAQQSAVLVLDEPTAFLDVTGRIELTTMLAALAHRDDLAVIASTHDLDLALAHADRVWLVADGGLTDGSPEAIVADGRLGAAFDSDVVALDPGTGMFRPRAPGGRPVVASSPIVARLIARVGGEPIGPNHDDAEQAWRIEACGAGWILHTGDEPEPAGSLDDLAQLLRDRLASVRR
jgi:iron complex transport system ATP-binding protein